MSLQGRCSPIPPAPLRILFGKHSAIAREVLLMWSVARRGILAAAAVAAMLGIVGTADAAPKKSFKVAWSIYVGWMPWPYADETGILKKWADKYGISIQ